MLFVRLAVILAALCAAPVFADEAELPNPVRMGFEIEATIDSLANLTGRFDFAALQATIDERFDFQVARQTPSQFFRRRFGHDLTRDYLRNDPSALASLPPELRAELTRGLDLGARTLRETVPLVGADGKALEARRGLILPDAPSALAPARAPITTSPRIVTAPVAPAPAAPLFQTSAAGLQVPPTAAWEELQRRWEAIDPEERWNVCRWERYGPREKAALAIAFDAYLQPRADLDPVDAKLFQRLKFARDGDSLEITYRDEFVQHDPTELLADVRRLGRGLGIERELFDPENARMMRATRKVPPPPWGSFHVHFSTPSGARFDRLAKLHNLDLLMRRLTLGITSDLRNEDYTFSSTVQSRGLVRLVGGNRYETRTHHEPLEEELKRHYKLLSASDRKAAIEKFSVDIRRRLTPAILHQMLTQTPVLARKAREALYPVLDEPATRELYSAAVTSFEQNVEKSPSLAVRDALLAARLEPRNPGLPAVLARALALPESSAFNGHWFDRSFAEALDFQNPRHSALRERYSAHVFEALVSNDPLLHLWSVRELLQILPRPAGPDTQSALIKILDRELAAGRHVQIHRALDRISDFGGSYRELADKFRAAHLDCNSRFGALH